MTDTSNLLDPDMPAQELRLHMGEMTADEERAARAAIRWANSRAGKRVKAAVEAAWDDATNAVCQLMQDKRMCKCRAGGCLAATVVSSPQDIAAAIRAGKEDSHGL